MKPIRILFADDEPVILRGLRRLLPWSSLGFEIVGEAYDGDELKELLETSNPDVVISDINMPGLTGIDIIREINESGRNIKMVFISAYQEFSYAQDAVKYGAIDYLLKPVDKDRLETVMRKVVRLIGEQSERFREREMANRFEKQNHKHTIEELLERLADGDKGAISELRRLGVIKGNRYMTFCFGDMDKNVQDNSIRWQDQERKLVDFAITNVLSEAVSQTGASIYFRKGELHGIFIQHDLPGESLAAAEELHRQINGYLKISFTLGLGMPVDSLSEAVFSAETAEAALKSRYFEGLNRVVSARQHEADTEAKTKLEKLQQKLAASLTHPLQEEAEDTAWELIQAVRRFALNNRSTAITAIYASLRLLEVQLKELGVTPDEADSDEHTLLERLNGFHTFSDLTEYFNACALELKNRAAEKLGNKELIQLVQVKAYIDEKYADNITLESMAGLVYMNPYYFSSFFKKHTGDNFKQYLTSVRMKHAHKMLIQSDLMVYEIAELVGYNNARQFSDMFKKRYGKLPLEYKQSLKGN